MKRLVCILALIPLLATAQDKGKTFKISGKMEKLAYPVDYVFLQYRVNGDWRTDSVKAVGNSYKFTGKIEEPTRASIRVRYTDPEPGKKIPVVSRRDVTSFFIQPGKIKLSSVDSFSNITVKGSPAQTEFLKLQAKVKPYNDKTEPLYALYSQFNRSKENAARDRVEHMIDSIEKQMSDDVYGNYVKNNPGSPIAMYALQQFAGWDINPDLVEPVFNTLPESTRSMPSAVEFKEKVEIAKKTGVGKIAMDFTQNDTLGVPVSLSSLRGKYVLVDFWASWCGPCRAENPNVVKVYQKYKDRGFHIIGVSLDRPGQKEKWLKAIHDDGLAWTQVSDLQFWNNEVAKLYGIQAIPQNLLLDPTGRIIAKNVRGEELDQKVGEAIAAKDPKAF